MRIAVIGAGNVGGTLGRRLATLGHEVVFGVRRPAEGAAAVKGGEALPHGASVATMADAVRGAEAVLVATPWGATEQTLRALGGALDGLPLLDATNPLGPGVRVEAGADGASGGERVQAWAPGARVVKVFNTTGFETMRDPSYGGTPATMFYAGDDAAAKGVARDLATALGFEAVDAGALSRARELEHLAALWVSLAFGGMGRAIAFRLMRR